MRIFLTGGSGFVGRALARLLADQGYQLRCLARGGSALRLPPHAGIQAVSADLFDVDALTKAINGADAVIHLVGIIREFPSRDILFQKLHVQATAAVVAASERAGVKRYLHMSANGSRPDVVSNYHRTKWQAEELVRDSSLAWTIFRPSLIYGPEDQFINMISAQVRFSPLLPVIGDGRYQLQPVPVEQVAESFGAALSNDATIGKVYHCGGADCISYNQLLDQVAAALGKRKPRKIHQPLGLMKPLVRLLQHLPFFPLTSDQLQMLLEGNCCDNRPWAADCGLEPASFGEGLVYLEQK